jgi:hypothetical protein
LQLLCSILRTFKVFIMLSSGSVVISHLNIEINTRYEDIYVILFGNKKDLYDKNQKSNTCVPQKTIRTYVE